MADPLHEALEYLSMDEDQQKKAGRIRIQASNLMKSLDELVPSREASLAKTKLEESAMWAIKAVSREA